MRTLQLQEPKARLSSVVNDAMRGEAAIITRRGSPQAVILGLAEWERLSRVPAFGRLLMSAQIEEGDIPDRNAHPARDESSTGM